MTAHVGPIARPSPLERLRVGLRRGRPKTPKVESILTHLHDTPRVTVATDHGILRGELMGLCLWEKQLQAQFTLVAPDDLALGAVTLAFGGFNHTEMAPEPAPIVRKGERIALSLVFLLGEPAEMEVDGLDMTGATA